MRDPLASGDYARKQIYCPSRVVAWSHGSRFRLAAQLAATAAGGRLLDYGCGDGTFLALTNGTHADAVGADVDAAQLEVPFAGPEQIEVHLGRAVAPGGFAWIVPFMRGDRAFNRVGLMCEDGAAARFGEFLAGIRQRYGLSAVDWPAPRLKILPLGPVARTYSPRIVAVGDAAGLVKPTTGGGIYYSLISGQIAAEVIDPALGADDLSERRLREYEDRWRARLGAEIRTGLRFRKLVARLNDRAIDSLVELARIDGLVPLLKQTADFNWHASSALALLRHAQFRRILLGTIWE